ncbi:hypothetical protein GGR56DRAFT_680530 [Xylariaceae sp. FL0804]|nr:hypothetical protein GGR56DRAFT_680530 [Xylariaceae sp. FL0804]
MSTLQTRPDEPFRAHSQKYDRALAEFKALRKKYERKNINEEVFILVEALTSELRDRSRARTDEQDYENDLHRLYMTAMHKESDDIPGLKQEDLEKASLKIFYILLEIEFPQLIELFFDYQVNDGSLPLPPSKFEIDSPFKSAVMSAVEQESGNYNDFYKRFHEAQSAWCPLEFELEMSKDAPNQLVPFYQQWHINPYRDGKAPATNNANLWKVDVPEEVIGPNLRETLKDWLWRSLEVETGLVGENGGKVLNIVPDWHKYLKNSKRYTDVLTFGVLDMVDKHMLVTPAEDRWNAGHIYLVDNGSSMAEHWSEATFLLEVLVWRSLGYDEDGMELYFTNPNTQTRVLPRKREAVEDFVRAMNEARPEGEGPRAHMTNICEQLKAITLDYVKNKADVKVSERPKTIIILTDGVWAGTASDEPEETIKNWYHALKGLNGHVDPGNGPAEEEDLAHARPITFQFVAFGQHAPGIAHMRRLDDYLESDEYPDLIDVEPSNGDLYKMLLGSLDQGWDARENAVNTLPPPTPIDGPSRDPSAPPPGSRPSKPGMGGPQSPT